MAKKACVGGRARPCACALLVLTLLPAPGMQALREPPALARSCAGFAALPRLPLPCLRDAIRPSRAGLARLRASSLRVNGSRQGSGGGVGGGGIGGVRQGSGPSGMAAALPMPATKVLPSGSLREQREKLNQMHVERQAWYDLMRRRVRASSYQDGALDVRRLFSQFDTNKSGSLDLAEYRALLMRVGLRPFFITDEDLRVLFYEMGATGRGLEVRAREFFAWFSGSGQASVVGPVAQEQGTWKASVAASVPGSARAWKSPEVVRGGEATSTRAADGWSYGESVWWDEGPETRVLKSIVQADAQLVPESAAAGPGKPRVRTAPAVTAEQSAVLSVASQLLDTRAETDHLQPLLAMVEPWTQTTRDKLLSSLHFLVTELGLPASKVKALALENPGVFGLDVDYQMRPRIDALREIGMPIKSIPKFLAVVPDLLEANGWERRQGAMTFLTELGIPQERLGACLARHPRVLDLSFETMSSVVDFLVVEGGIPRAKVSKIVEVMPSLLSHSVDRNLRPKISFLVEDVGIAPEGLAAVLLKFPQVLGLSVEGNLRPTVRYLTDELGVMHSDLSRILTSMPQLLGLSVQGNLQVKVKYLVSELGIPKDRIRDIVVMSPALLSLSVEKNLLPKVQFLVEEAGFSVQEIIKAPNILAYSLDRMRSRHEFLTKKGLKLGLASMVSYSNTEFQRRFDHDGDLL
jgi:hypothetical protein